MATVTSRAGTAARRLFSTCYLPNPGSATTTTDTNFCVEESRLLVVVSLTCLWIRNPKESAIVSCPREWHWEISCFKDTLPATGPGPAQGPPYHSLLWGIFKFLSSSVCACVCVCGVFHCALCFESLLLSNITLAPSVQLDWSQKHKGKSWTSLAAFLRGSTSTKDCEDNDNIPHPTIAKISLSRIINYI